MMRLHLWFDFRPLTRFASFSGTALCLLSMIVFAGACKSEGSPAGRSRVDALGRAVQIGKVERVSSLAPSVTEMVFAAGAGHRLVGVTSADDYPPAIEGLPRHSILPVDFEAVVAQRPDLVIASTQVNGVRDADTFAALGIPTFFVGAARLDDVFAGIETLGDLLGTSARARVVTDSLRRRVDTLRKLTEGVPRPRVLVLISDESLFSFGRESYVHEIVALAGGASITAEMQMTEPVLSDEFVLTAQPDVIVGTFGRRYDARRLLARHPTWEVVPAVRTGRVFSIEESLLQRPGPRLVEAAWMLAAMLHPERFAGRTRP